MKNHRIALFLFTLLTACGAATTAGHQSPKFAFAMRDVQFPMRDFRFPSGLRVIVEEDHRMPLVAVTSVVGAGSTSDPPGKEGLAHYVEHLTFRARPDGKVSVESLLTQAGAGAHNASTAFDRTTYYSVGPKEALEGLLILESQRLLAPVDNVAPAAAALELEVVRNELRLRGETGYIGAALGAMQAAVFPEGHPYHRSIIGTHASLSSLSLADAQAFVKAHYRPENATIVIVGDVNLKEVGPIVEGAIPKELRAGAGAKPAAPRLPEKAPVPPEPSSEKLAKGQANVPTPELWVGWSLPRSFDSDSVLLEAVTRAARAALGGAFRADQDISGVDVRLVDGREASMLLSVVHLRAGNHPERSMDHLLDQLVKLWQLAPAGGGGLDAAAAAQAAELSFSLFRRTVVTSMLSDGEDLVTRAEQRALGTHFTGDPLVYSRKLKAASELPASAVADFANKHLTRDRARAVLFTPSVGDAADRGKEVPADPDPEPLPPAPDAETMRAFTRPLGVSRYAQLRLPNGLEVIVGERPGLPVATVGLSFHGGEGADLGAERLVDLLSEPVVTTRVKPAQFGARFRSSGTRDDYQYWMSGSSGNVVDMIELLGEWVSGMKVRDDRALFFQREMLASIVSAESWPEAAGSRAFWNKMYPESPYGHVPVGADLAKITSGKANDWIHASHVGKNGTLVVVGELDDVAAVHEAIKSAFGGLSEGAEREAPGAPLLAKAAPKPAFVMVPRPGATQLEITFGCAVPPPKGSLATLDVAARLLGMRLNDRLRRRLGASYGMSARTVALRGGATHLQGGGSIDNVHASKAMEILRDSIAEFSKDPDAADLDRARWAKALGYAVSYSSVEDIGSAVLDARNLGLPLDAIDRYPADVLEVKGAQVAEIFRACAANPVVVAVGDAASGEAAFKAAWP